MRYIWFLMVLLNLISAQNSLYSMKRISYYLLLCALHKSNVNLITFIWMIWFAYTKNWQSRFIVSHQILLDGRRSKSKICFNFNVHRRDRKFIAVINSTFKLAEMHQWFSLSTFIAKRHWMKRNDLTRTHNFGIIRRTRNEIFNYQFDGMKSKYHSFSNLNWCKFYMKWKISWIDATDSTCTPNRASNITYASIRVRLESI